MKENKLWRIREGMDGETNLKAIIALIFMMDIGVRDERFRNYADKNPEFYNWFEVNDGK
jgi:hypothetical protein